MAEMNQHFYHDDDDVLGKVKLEASTFTLTALIVTAEDTQLSVEMIDTSEFTDYELTILINAGLARHVAEAGILPVFIEALGTATYLILKERADAREND